MATRTTRPGLVGISLLAAGIGGCGNLNQSSRIGDRVELETFSDNPPVFEPIQAGQTDGASISGLGRDRWASRSIVQPAGDVASRPYYTSGLEPLLSDTTARQRGEYPTETSSLDTWTHWGRLSQAGEAAVAPFWYAFDLVAAPARMFVTPPWRVVHSPAPANRVPAAGSTGVEAQP